MMSPPLLFYVGRDRVDGGSQEMPMTRFRPYLA
jgi:hypothetical protein